MPIVWEVTAVGWVAAAYIALGFMVILSALVSFIAAIFNVSIFGFHPFGRIGTDIHNALVRWADDAVDNTANVATHSLAFLTYWTSELVDINYDLMGSINYGLSYLWNQALPGAISRTTSPIRALATATAANLSALASTVAANLQAAYHRAHTDSVQAFDNAKAYTNTEVQNLRTEVNTDVASVHDFAKSKFQAAESDIATLRAQVNAQLVPLANGVAAVPGEIASATQTAEQTAALALQGAEAAAAGARQILQDQLTAAINDAKTQEGQLAGTVATLGAALAITSTLAKTVAAEVADAGLNDKTCRAKTKGICGVNPAKWAEFLAGFAVMSGAFSLESFIRDTVEAAKVVLPEIEKVVRSGH